jgi:hypothetical protein
MDSWWDSHVCHILDGDHKQLSGRRTSTDNADLHRICLSGLFAWVNGIFNGGKSQSLRI